MPTLQDVAKHAGVSTATVSKVLSNTPYFTEETRARVMASVTALGYRPNLAARALSSGKTNTIAVIFPHIYDTIFKDPLVMQILEGIESVATEQGYNLLLSTPRLNGHDLDESYHQLIQSGYVEGVLAIDNVPSASAAAVAMRYNIPTVVLGLHSGEFVVRNDDREGGRLQMRHLHDLGHRAIGIISIEPSLNLAVEERICGLREIAVEMGIAFDDLPVAYGDFSERSGAKALAHLLDEHPQLTAIICMNDRMALGALQAAQGRGLDIPADLTLIGYDDIPSAAVFSPALTTINQRAVSLGEAAAQMLFQVLLGEQPTPVVTQPLLQVRGTSAKPRL